MPLESGKRTNTHVFQFDRFQQIVWPVNCLWNVLTPVESLDIISICVCKVEA